MDPPGGGRAKIESVHERLDLALGEVAPLDCQVFGVAAGDFDIVRQSARVVPLRTVNKELIRRGARSGIGEPQPLSRWTAGPGHF